MTHSNLPTYPMHEVSWDELLGKLGQLQHLQQHTCIKAVLLEKEEFKSNQLYYSIYV